MSSGKTIGLIKAVGGPGGGGGTSDAVQYIPQELTENQQMQARKNLGVYWKGKTTQTVYNGVLDQRGENGDGTKAIGFADDYSRPNVLEAGKRYSVTVNGEIFDNLLCVEGTEMDGLPACFLGNMSICRTMGNPPNEDDNGLPFGVMSCEYVTSVRCLVDKDPDDYFESTEDFMKDTSVKIEGVSESITTIPTEYLPTEGRSLMIDLTYTAGDGEVVFSLSKSYEEICTFLIAGGLPIIRLDLGNGGLPIYYRYGGNGTNSLSFPRYFTSDGYFKEECVTVYDDGRVTVETTDIVSMS